MNTPATQPIEREFVHGSTEPTLDVPELPPGDVESSESSRSARAERMRAGLAAWKEAGGSRGAPKDPIEKLAENPKSLRLAITAMCWHCQNGDADPAPKWRVGNCLCVSCPLHAVRPYQQMSGRPEPAVLRS